MQLLIPAQDQSPQMIGHPSNSLSMAPQDPIQLMIFY